MQYWYRKGPFPSFLMAYKNENLYLITNYNLFLFDGLRTENFVQFSSGNQLVMGSSDLSKKRD